MELHEEYFKAIPELINSGKFGSVKKLKAVVLTNKWAKACKCSKHTLNPKYALGIQHALTDIAWTEPNTVARHIAVSNLHKVVSMFIR